MRDPPPERPGLPYTVLALIESMTEMVFAGVDDHHMRQRSSSHLHGKAC
jgi:hypothetical protein